MRSWHEILYHRACHEARAVEYLEYIPQGFELESSKVLLTTCESTGALFETSSNSEKACVLCSGAEKKSLRFAESVASLDSEEELW